VGSDPSDYADLSDDARRLRGDYGCEHGEMLYLLHHLEGRKVEPAYKRNELDAAGRPFGARMTVADISARQFKLERQDKAAAASVSLDRWAANKFQEYVSSALAFSIKRGGLMYGTVDEEGKAVSVDVIYEPPQRGTPHSLVRESTYVFAKRLPVPLIYIRRHVCFLGFFVWIAPISQIPMHYIPTSLSP
jgi:nuclear protein localization protein 4 homolog